MRIYGITEELKPKKINTTDKGRKQILTRMMKPLVDQSMKGYSLIDKRYGFLDGHRIFIGDSNFEFEESCLPFHLEQIVKEEKKENQEYSIKINREYIEYAIKNIWKDSNRQPLVVEDDGYFLAFNPRFLLDSIKWSGSEVFFYNRNNNRSKAAKNCLTSPIFQYDDKGNLVTVTLPIYLNNIDKYETSLDYLEL